MNRLYHSNFKIPITVSPIILLLFLFTARSFAQLSIFLSQYNSTSISWSSTIDKSGVSLNDFQNLNDCMFNLIMTRL